MVAESAECRTQNIIPIPNPVIPEITTKSELSGIQHLKAGKALTRLGGKGGNLSLDGRVVWECGNKEKNLQPVTAIEAHARRGIG